MLKIVHGDLFAGAIGRCVIAHGANSLGSMGSGFAKQLRMRYPLAYLEYRRACRERRPRVGEWQLVYVEDKAIFHLITQDTYGNDPDTVYVDYDAVKKCLQVVASYCASSGLTAHMPFIGSGLAHGDPAKLMAIFEEVFKSENAVLYLRERQPKKRHHGH